ncbi:MAG: hypothetical protein KAR62_02925, partial [Sphingomonadales bacterium]|nr:hypothetical protein [Sphingomonadales bacterium]
DIFLDPNDPEVIKAARAEGIPDAWIEGAKTSPIYKMAIDWKVAFPLHPEYRTLPMVWYIPPLSPVQSKVNTGELGVTGNGLPDVDKLRIPVKYLANMLTAGDEAPVRLALSRMAAMRVYMRGKTVLGEPDLGAIDEVDLSVEQVEEMYHLMAIANYEDRFNIPTNHREEDEDTYKRRGECGFTFGNGCSDGNSEASLFGTPSKKKREAAE